MFAAQFGRGVLPGDQLADHIGLEGRGKNTSRTSWQEQDSLGPGFISYWSHPRGAAPGACPEGGVQKADPVLPVLPYFPGVGGNFHGQRGRSGELPGPVALARILLGVQAVLELQPPAFPLADQGGAFRSSSLGPAASSNAWPCSPSRLTLMGVKPVQAKRTAGASEWFGSRAGLSFQPRSGDPHTGNGRVSAPFGCRKATAVLTSEGEGARAGDEAFAGAAASDGRSKVHVRDPSL